MNATPAASPARRRRRPARAALLAGVVLPLAAPVLARARVPDLPVERYVLDNGLEVLLHRDPTVPTVHVEVWYKVGSKDEEPGRTGFAHLFEHLMFQGTKHVPEDAHFKYLSEAGASIVNGSTSNDRTNYFEALPAGQLELALWLESSRMGFLLDRPDFKATLDNQRDVVKNERRQRIENQPMGGVGELQLAELFPEGHPYRHEIIGSMADLDAASEEDVRAFFLRYYAPNNAVLFLGGDFEPERARTLIARYFGPLRPGPPVLRRPVPALPPRTAPVHVAMEAAVRLPTRFWTWNTVPLFAAGEAELDVIAALLAEGKSARLQRRLVHEERRAESVQAYQWGLLHAGLFQIEVTPLPGQSIDACAAAVEEELRRLTETLVDERELARVKNGLRTQFVAGLESLYGRAMRLLTYHYFAGDADYVARDWARYDAVTPASLREVALRVFGQSAPVVVTVEPNPEAPIMGRRKP